MAKFARLAPIGRLQTPIRAFRHPQTGRRVTVVATNHYGTPGYYQRLLHAITVLQQGGATVLREGTKTAPADDPDLAQANEAEKTALGGYVQMQLAMAATFEQHFGWTHEHLAFGWRDDWHYVDLSMAAFVQQAGAQNVQQTVTAATTNKKTGQALDPRQLQAVMRLRLTVSLRVIGLVPGWMQREWGTDLDQVMLEQRDKLVLDTIDTLGGDVVPIWGARHLTGLTSGLLARGYQHTGRDTWHTVGRIPPIRKALWHKFTTNRAVKRDTTATAVAR
ncbi:hypothetical protein [Actinoplanes sp. NPDC049265]|uniref:hypothetical protein n=1 Tax=Actinoplanes sp. NPDC049265 TaxID=3363902 RepID=UPI003711CB23